MASAGTPDDWSRLADPPSDVRVTVVVVPQGRAPGAGLRSPVGVGALAGLLLALAALAGLLIAGPAGDRPGSAAVIGRPHAAVTPSGAAAYRYPLGCMGGSLSGSGRGWSARRFDAASPCWRYGTYVTAILRRVHGMWRLALKVVSPSCPAVSLPAFVRAQVAVCAREP